ncbi:ecdysteroid 22-kinase family protein [Aestuariibacter sp. AA17]|uniref:Ecdysteroid 22-kinase family protein n=1 Tax=Fluctibacter corallii TaxID=2984329 RepID=A0ABT3A8H3_9ALTE|nr:ecdysteroid 22-kinase family protein [Aestuariibacter sp. AA17]MCV2884959.1 ecdysteroid 22-kinase family protein [Aestuariibacter sp. AA17]
MKDYIESLKLTDTTLVQPLWSGYGQILRGYSQALHAPVVIKWVNPPNVASHPRGWNTAASHQRKLQSFATERQFYLFHRLPRREKGELSCLTANLLASEQEGQGYVFVLEDLAAKGFTQTSANVNALGHSEAIAKATAKGPSRASVETHIRTVLYWLADFHAYYLVNDTSVLPDVGSYWHLATRLDEWQAMADGQLKQCAKHISTTLHRAQFKTLLHGDAKLANFCFTQSGACAAAVDFQYVGQGAGVQDVAYFLGGVLNSKQLFSTEKHWLSCYFSRLASTLDNLNADIPTDDVVAEWQMLYPYAWADFHRFLAGWKPDHVKINDYMACQTDRVLKALNACSRDNE